MNNLITNKFVILNVIMNINFRVATYKLHRHHPNFCTSDFYLTVELVSIASIGSNNKFILTGEEIITTISSQINITNIYCYNNNAKFNTMLGLIQSMTKYYFFSCQQIPNHSIIEYFTGQLV